MVSRPALAPLRWAARIVGTLAGAFFLFFVFGQALGKPDSLPSTFALLLAFSILGVLLAWRSERVGGWLAIVASVALGLVVYSSGPADPVLGAAFYVLPFLVPGILFVICSHAPAPVENRASRSTDA